MWIRQMRRHWCFQSPYLAVLHLKVFSLVQDAIDQVVWPGLFVYGGWVHIKVQQTNLTNLAAFSCSHIPGAPHDDVCVSTDILEIWNLRDWPPTLSPKMEHQKYQEYEKYEKQTCRKVQKVLHLNLLNLHKIPSFCVQRSCSIRV